ncbi:hypothetical protein VitviT2T_000936 [Vitis vinifera]|uniref:Uncharacterized protein n=1 Tax=Vitis vinifera TaxID=29760 RepID=A0ABY9BE28_VITVI|nr:hypothetical protein VitviT2T_000936 [Vitis vinifera]
MSFSSPSGGVGGWPDNATSLSTVGIFLPGPAITRPTPPALMSPPHPPLDTCPLLSHLGLTPSRLLQNWQLSHITISCWPFVCSVYLLPHLGWASAPPGLGL